MSRKQVTFTDTSIMGAAPARARAPRGHKPGSKPATPHAGTAETQAGAETVTVIDAPEVPLTSSQPADEREAISRLAYSYWEARGRQGGSAEEDWLRAEREYRATIL